ncbi:N-acetyltransferase [Echinicola pacifica]|uniref:N-acetyltransferase n=1 Tax=Echinicola pacifica TaxID=346377 RepID=A0A918UVL0_9BACT|nr:GNAT family N-acetyltransferase [Echinicola pacifica]GGZ35993.1 N-acetyltransferase [Echinicola pacifica]
MTELVVEKIQNKETLQQAFDIRQKVFVEGQNVAAEEEYDEFEESSVHFLARINGTPVGTARYRKTTNGVKLERFAVLEDARGKGVGQGLMNGVIEDIQANFLPDKTYLYLHAQLHAVPLYAKFKFQQVGDIFSECDILHYKMERYL